MYHVSEKYNKSLKDISSKANNVGKSGKKIVAVTSLSSGDNQCVTEKKRVNQNIYHDGRILFMILTDIFLYVSLPMEEAQKLRSSS
jgi:hypothetical protein